jgi:transposase
MSRILSQDLRERVVGYHKEHGVGRIILSRIFKIGSATAYRWISQEARTGSLAPKSPARRGPAAKISDSQLDELRAVVAEKPDRTHDELAAVWTERTGVSVSDNTIHRALVRANMSLKKRRFALQSETEPTSSRSARSSARRSQRSTPTTSCT